MLALFATDVGSFARPSMACGCIELEVSQVGSNQDFAHVIALLELGRTTPSDDQATLDRD